MSPPPTLDRGIVTSIVSSIETLEGDVERLVEQSDLSSIWSNPDQDVVPEANVWRLFELSRQTLDMPDVGVRVGRQFRLGDLGDFGRRLQSSLTVFSCLSEYINKVNQYSSHSRFWLEPSEGGVWFCRQGIDLIGVGRKEVEQFTLELMIRLVQTGCGPDWIPQKIAIQASEDRFFNASDRYGSAQFRYQQPSTAIWLSSLDMLRIVDWNDDEIIKLIRDSVSLGHIPQRPTISSTSRKLGFSVRTLQRELSRHGLDWSRMLEQVRLSRADRLLRHETPLAEIAVELGYTDQANFGRAFRRWTGVAPRSYRRLVAS